MIMYGGISQKGIHSHGKLGGGGARRKATVKAMASSQSMVVDHQEAGKNRLFVSLTSLIQLTSAH